MLDFLLFIVLLGLSILLFPLIVAFFGVLFCLFMAGITWLKEKLTS